MRDLLPSSLPERGFAFTDEAFLSAWRRWLQLIAGAALRLHRHLAAVIS